MGQPVHLLWMTCVFCVIVSGPAVARDHPAPATALLLGKLAGPMEYYRVRLVIENRNEKPTWFVLPYFGDQSLPDSGTFQKNAPGFQPHDQPFGAKEYRGTGGTVIEVLMYGGAGFRAFRLPAHGKLELDGYMIEANKSIGAVPVWEVNRLSVNGDVPLEKWLPYPTLSGANVKVPAKEVQKDWRNLDYIPGQIGGRRDYPKKKVEFVTAEGIKRWTVKFTK